MRLIPLALSLAFRPRDILWSAFLILWLDPEGFSQWVMTIAFLILLALWRIERRGSRLAW